MFSKLWSTLSRPSSALRRDRGISNSTPSLHHGHDDGTTSERKYLCLLEKILRCGSVEHTRTGVRTRTLFGEQLRFDLSDNRLPLLTTKHVSFANVAHELLWMMSGSTNNQDLERRGVKIWRGNASPGYLRQVGLDHKYRPYHDLGPIYPHQWRHFGAPYIDCETDYSGKVR